MKSIINISSRIEILKELKLNTLHGIKSWKGGLIKNKRGRADVSRIEAKTLKGDSFVIYLKRIWSPYKKDGIKNLVKHGKVISSSKQEWQSYQKLQSAGIDTPELIAYGEECGPFYEHFSFIITGEVKKALSLDEFLDKPQNSCVRYRALSAVADTIFKMHKSKIISNDLYARHIFVSHSQKNFKISFIDMPRLENHFWLFKRKVIRDISLLNLSIPIRSLSLIRRKTLLKKYRKKFKIASLFWSVEKKSKKLLIKRKNRYKRFLERT